MIAILAAGVALAGGGTGTSTGVSGAGRIRAVLIVAVGVRGRRPAPAAASAHAYLVRTAPVASGVLNAPPPTVALTFDEAVEPRFAIISVTDAARHSGDDRPRRRSPANPDTLVVPLRPRLPEGWYLVYWRAISVDGHPVQGAFTYAVGPNPGPAPQFPVPTPVRDGGHAPAAGRALDDVPLGDERDRAARAAPAVARPAAVGRRAPGPRPACGR